MKRSEAPAESRQLRQAYIDLRWKQLSDLCTTWGDESIKYLLFVNAAAMAGALSFIGAMQHIRQFQWPYIALSLFVLGVVLVGLYHAARYHRTDWLFRQWRESVGKYSSDEVEWNDLLDRDAERSKKWNWPLLLLAYGSLLCFFSGVSIAAVNFHEISVTQPKENSHGGEKITRSGASTVTTAPARTEASAGLRPERTPAPGNDRPERASAGSGSTTAAASPKEPLGDTTKREPNDGESPDMVRFTFWLMIFTGVLAISTIGLWWVTKRSANAAQDSADAAVKSVMPVLSPLVVWHDLHPLAPNPATQPVAFDSRLHVVFENYGKLPGIIRELRMDLVLNKMDEAPKVDFEKLPPLRYAPIIPGESRGQNALMGVADFVKPFTLSALEFNELLAEATGVYRRFALVGQVIYDDFFGMRHTRRFCVKLRNMGGAGMFQLVWGGVAYNSIKREKIPKRDPLEPSLV